MNNKITLRQEDFAKWYTDIIQAARLCRYSAVKGFVILEENGYALWENIQKNLDNMFKETGHKNVYLPMLIPESLLKKEAELIEGFAPEVAWITHGGDKKLEDRLCVRPTSETLFCEYYKDVTKSYKDLPKLCNQWCSVVRWEKETRPFLRTREFLWQEGHTIHETPKEAEEETFRMLNIYKKLCEEYLAIPVLAGRKTEKEKFAGAEYTLTLESLMQNGVSLQSATSHYFGDKFSKAYDVKFLGRENKLEYPYQTSWGITTRIIGALIMVHSDDRGLVLPPKIAPTQVSIINIGKDEEVNNFSNNLAASLKEKNISFEIDNSDKMPGFKFAESEVKGIPLRIEVGKRDLDKNIVVMARRDNYEKIEVKIEENLAQKVEELLETIQKSLFEKALKNRENHTYIARNLEEMENIINTNPGFIKAMWCGNKECEEKIKEIKSIKSRLIPFEEEHICDECVVCKKEAKHQVVWGIQY